MYLYKSTLDVSTMVMPIGDNERRPLLLLEVAGPMGSKLGMAFIHAIANSTASAKQLVDLLQLIAGFGVQFIAGDMNHAPPDNRSSSSSTHSMGLRKRKSTYEIVSTGTPTHYSSTHGSYAELDWAYSSLDCKVARVDTTTFQGKSLHVWKGVNGTGASDHAAMLYALG